jgi:acyl dehydratase
MRAARAEMVKAGGVLAEGSMTLGAWIRRWLETAVATSVQQRRRRPPTAASYARLFKDYVEPDWAVSAWIVSPPATRTR